MTKQDGDDLGVWSEFGTAAGLTAGKVSHDLAGGGGAGEPAGEEHSGMGDRPDLDGLPPVTGMGDAPVAGSGLGAAIRHATEAVHKAAPPKGYHNRVDADGDGHQDHATYQGDGHGGVEIMVDLDHDGRTDFIGHDTDLDNRVDFAEYDKDHDGVFEKKMYDDNNDGYLDRAEWTHDS
jgi:hypothetical protein